MSYPFVDDDGNIHELTFDQMMSATDGFYQQEDGTWLRRVRDATVSTNKVMNHRAEIISDSMGFPEAQLPAMQKHLRDSGVKGVEFVRDKDEPKFFQVKLDGPNALSKYLKARNMHDYNSKNGSGATLTALDIANARELVLRK